MRILLAPSFAPHTQHSPGASRPRRTLAWPALALTLAACGGGGGATVKDANDGGCPDAGCGADAGPDGSDQGAQNGTTGGAMDAGSNGDASTDRPLEGQLQVNGNDAPCGECSVLIAQANGGRGPYTYAWSDDSLQGPGPHRVCPDAPTDYTVTVTDDSANESPDPEFSQEAQEIELSAQLTCVDDPDAWGGCYPPPPAPAEGEAGPGEECDWIENDPATRDLLGLPERTAVAFGNPVPTEAGEALTAGKTYEVSYDQLVLSLNLGQPVMVEVWGGHEPCDQGQLIGTLTLDGRWHQSFCFEAEEDWSYIRIDIDSGDTIFYLDFVKPVATLCKGCAQE